MGALVRCLAWASAVLVELSALLILLCVGSAMGFECMLSKVHAARVRIAALTLHARSSVLGYLLLLFPPLALAALPDPSMRPCGKTGGAIVLLPAPSPELAHALAVALAANTQGDSGACLPAAGPWGVRALFQDVLTRFFPTPRRGNTVLVLVPDEVSLRALIPRWAQVKAAHNRTKSSPSPPSRGLVGVPDLLKGWRIGDEASSLKSEWSERSERSDSSPTSSPPRRHIGRVIPLLCTEKSEKSEYVQTLVQEYCDSHSLTLRGVVLLPPARIEDMQVARKLITTSKSRLVQLASGDHAGVKGATKVYISTCAFLSGAILTGAPPVRRRRPDPSASRRLSPSDFRCCRETLGRLAPCCTRLWSVKQVRGRSRGRGRPGRHPLLRGTRAGSGQLLH